MTRRTFGQVRQLRSGRWQARWRLAGVWYTARRASDGGPRTFNTEKQAEDYLTWVKAEIDAGRWAPPVSGGKLPHVLTFREYATAWLRDRDLAPTTRDHYARLLRDHVYPTFGDAAVTSITPSAVRAWHAGLAREERTAPIGAQRKRRKVPDRPTVRAHAYGLLRTILNTAVADELIAANPCRVRGGGQARRVKQIRPATLAELETIVAALPARYRLAALLASWCGLRFGEMAELRRGDVDVTNGLIHVRRGVVRTSEGRKVKGPKSQAGRRDVAIPPHLMPMVRQHLRDHAQAGKDGLLFPARHGGHLAPATLYRVFYPARAAALRPDLRWHDLRHTGAVLAASTGATLAELMARLGHSTPGAALRYQHAAKDRDRAIADALSKLVTGNVTDIKTARAKRHG
jgi:integrase